MRLVAQAARRAAERFRLDPGACRDYYHPQLPGGTDPDLYDLKGTPNGDGTYSRVRRGERVRGVRFAVSSPAKSARLSGPESAGVRTDASRWGARRRSAACRQRTRVGADRLRNHSRHTDPGGGTGHIGEESAAVRRRVHRTGATLAIAGTPSYTVQISIAFLRLLMASCPSAGEYSWVTNPVKPRSAMACITKR